MSGHSKWSTIKHKKAASDAKRGAVFTKIAKKIQVAVKKGGSGDPEQNPALRTILDEARSWNMPSDNVRRAIDKALGVGEGSSIDEIVYEAYGPGGIGIMITCATDNRNRTGGEIKSVLEKHGGSLGGPGSVSYMLNLVPVPEIELVDQQLETAEGLLEILEEHDDVVDIWTNLKKADEQEA